MSKDPNEIKSQHELDEGNRKSDVLISAIEKCERLEQDLNNVLGILLKVSPEHEGYVRANFPQYFKENN